MKKNELNNKIGVYLCSSIFDFEKIWGNNGKDIFITLFITSGKIDIQVNGSKITYKENNIIFFRLKDEIVFYKNNSERKSNNDSFEGYAIFVSKDNYLSIMSLLGFPKGIENFDKNILPHVSECVDIQFNKMVREIKAIHATDVSSSNDNFDSIRLFIASIYNRYIDDIHQKIPKYINVPKWFNDYYDLLDNPSVFSQDFSKIIQLSGKTREHISRLFKSIVGVNISDYVNSKRISYACQLLENPENRIQDISCMCGFTNIGTFYNNFKKKIGESPERYRKISIIEARSLPKK